MNKASIRDSFLGPKCSSLNTFLTSKERKLNLYKNGWSFILPQVRLAESEQQLLEKELLYEQVGKLTDRAKKKVESQRLSTLAVAKKVNNYQAKIKAVTRKMMALVSELSMQQVIAYCIIHSLWWMTIIIVMDTSQAPTNILCVLENP